MATQAPYSGRSTEPHSQPRKERRARRHPRKHSTFRVIIRKADLSPEECEIRLRRGFDIVFDEVFRRQDEKQKRGRRWKAS